MAMKRKCIYIIKIVLIFIVLSVFLVGCKLNDDIGKEGVEEENSIGVGGKDYDILTRSENISNIVVDLYGIDNASSIIFNDVVVVAVEMAQDTNFNDDVKEMIIDAVLENDTMIRQVLITDNKKVFDQIEKIIESLMNGKTYDEHIKEINGIIEKLKKE
jgi:hypothetical protein